VSAPAALAASGVARRFGLVKALDGVDLEAREGETVLLLGPNGAGKTTLLRIVAGLLLATSGSVSVFGRSPRGDGGEARRRMGFLSHDLALYPDLTAAENLRFFARLYRVPDAPDRVDALLAESRLDAWRDEPVRSFSRGMKQRLALARVFLHRPDLLLLDEPFTGLDLPSSRSLGERLAEARGRGAALLVASHRLDMTAPLGDRAVVLRRGRVADSVDLRGLGIEERTGRLQALLREEG
jgi:heme ABC exporter ATP-binding subunit CcmA